jgi:hypothetical protein
MGVKEELRGTGVWSFIKASKKPGAAGPAKGPSKPVPRAEDLRKKKPAEDKASE